MAEVQKIDSNQTGLRICEELSLGVLPAAANQVWYPKEPNSYSDFGGQIKTVARKPINASRQNQKGVTVDLDAAGGFNQDFTQSNFLRELRGFFFASVREMFDTQAVDNTQTTVSNAVASDDTYRLAVGTDLVAAKIQAQSLVLASGFAIEANNGVNVVNSVASAKAVQTLTGDGTNITDGDTVTIGANVYTFEDTLTNVAGHVKKAATAPLSLTNLFHAINASGGVPGTDYALATVAHPSVVATNPSGTTVVVTALLFGRAGNLIATTEVSSHLSWGAATLAGGTADIDVAANLTDETPPSTARVQTVGYEFTVATVDVDVSNTLPRISRVSGAVDFTTLGLVAGQFVFVGGDAADEAFVNEENNGWMRVHSFGTNYIQFDKTTSTMVTEVGTGLTIRMFWGKVLKNELAESGLILRRSFRIERDLGQADTAIVAHQGEYLKGSIANQLTLNVKQADKFNADLSFVAIDHETRTQAEGLLSAAGGGVSAPALVSEDAFNTSDNIPRLRMAILDRSDANPSPLFAYLTDFTVVINNNVKPSKAVSVLGAFDAVAGNFDVSGKVTAYFSTVSGVRSVRENADVTFDFVFAFNNQGFVWDLPLVSLGDGRLNVEPDTEIKLPLDSNAAEDRVFHHTLMYGMFPYLPELAMA